MVDPVNPSGPIQGIAPANKSQKAESQSESKEARAEAVDEVRISQEALSLAQAEETAQKASKQLADDQTSTLSNNLENIKKLA